MYGDLVKSTTSTILSTIAQRHNHGGFKMTKLEQFNNLNKIKYIIKLEVIKNIFTK